MRNLTVIDAELERAEKQTAPGMAHWAGSGPIGATCGKCIHYGYTYVKSTGDHATKPSSCEKFYSMTLRHGGTLDQRQIACKYFEAKQERA
jgi:hypothetical protein